MREAIVHLLARYLEMRPLFLAPARPMKVEWKMSPYLGVLPRVFRALGKRPCFHRHSHRWRWQVGKNSTFSQADPG